MRTKPLLHRRRHLFASAAPCALVMSLFISAPALAESAFVTDQGEFNLRSGESTKHKIIRMLASGTAVEVLSANNTSGYSRVRLNDGTTGYILSRYLEDDPPARERIAAIQAKLDALQQAPDQLAAKLNKLQADHEILLGEHEETVKLKDQLAQELIEIRRSAANVVNITQERASLQEDVATLTRKLGELEQENLELRNRDNQHWFLTGAAVAGAGILIGLILPHVSLRRRRSKSWRSL